MNSELPVSADALLAERARLEEVLQSSEDWCELLRLKSRKDRGEGMSAVNAARLEMVLIDALAEDPDFIRYKAVCVALERLIRGLPPLPPKGEKPAVEKDDLTEIDGISASMQRRLNALDVTTFMQIAEWTNADVKSISSDLGLGRQIYEQDWIGQAEELATRSDAPVTAPPPKPSATPAAPPPKQIVAERPAAPPRPVEQRAAPVEKVPAPPQSPTVVREEPRPIIEARPESKSETKPQAKPIEATPEPVAAKPQTPAPAKVEAPTPKLVAPPSSDTKPEKSVDAQPTAIDTAKPAEIAPAKTEQKTEIKAEVPVQAVSAKSAPASIHSPAPTLASSSAPLADPPRPLKPEIYRVPASVSDTAVDVKAGAASPTAKSQEPTPQQPKQQPKSLQSEPLLPVPPSPLRVQQQPVAPSQVSPAPPPPSAVKPSSPAPASPAPALVELRAPPKPLVITRASLPPRPKIEIPAAPPPAVQRQPEQPRPVAVSTAKPPSSPADSGPFAALAALKPAAPSSPSSTPSMSIAEAIAYAAEVARQSPKTSSNGPGPNSASPSNAANAAVAVASAPPSQKLEPARPPVAAPQSPPPPKQPVAAPSQTPGVRAPAPAVVPAKPAVPPPLPVGFVPPPEDVETEQLDYRSARGLSSRNGGRDDSAGQRLYAEEATVEIVVKSAPDVVPTPRAALAKVAAETTTAAPAQRPATPIGRFLKALTGN